MYSYQVFEYISLQYSSIESSSAGTQNVSPCQLTVCHAIFSHGTRAGLERSEDIAFIAEYERYLGEEPALGCPQDNRD